MSTILVVDDTALAREAVAKLLEYEGFTVMRAVHGRDAWAMMYDNAPDLIGVYVGTLDDPSGFKPQIVMFASYGHGWDHLDPSVPKVPHMRPSS